MDSGARIGLVSLGGGARKGGAGGGGGGDGAGGPGGSNVGGPTALGKRPKTTSEATTPIELKQLIVEYCTQAAGPSDEVLGTLDQATLTHMLEAFSKQDYAPVATALTELIVQLRDHPQAPRRNVIASLAALSVRRPEMFRLPPVLSVLYMCLSKEYTPSLKRVPLITGFACHLVYRTLDGVVDWPLELVQFLVEDALGERAWVENELAQRLVLSVCSVFPTALPAGVVNRYPGPEIRAQVANYVISMVNHQVQWEVANTPNLVRFLPLVLGYAEVRAIAASRMDEWLAKEDTARGARDLLQKLCEQISDNSEHDQRSVQAIVNLKIRASQPQLYIDSVKQLLSNNSDYGVWVLRSLLLLELQQPRTQQQAASGATSLRVLNSFAASFDNGIGSELATVIQGLAAETSLRPHIRGLARRAITALKEGTVDFLQVCRGLMQPRPDMAQQPPPAREEWIEVLVDVVCQTMIISQLGGGAETSSTPTQPAGGSKHAQQRQMLVLMQAEAVRWCHETLLPLLPSSAALVKILRKLLILEPPIAYPAGEGTADAEAAVVVAVNSRLPVAEDSLTRVVILSITNGAALPSPTALAITHALLLRAARYSLKHDMSDYAVQNTQVVDAILKLSQLPTLPVASATLYWKGHICAMLLACLSTATVGPYVWANFPTLRILLQMLITNHYEFPPLVDTQTPAIIAEDTTRTQQEHLLLAQLAPPLQEGGIITFDPNGPPRCPPPAVMAELQQMSNELKLGSILRKRRDPDLLGQVMAASQGTGGKSGGAPRWLVAIARDQPDALNALPPPALFGLLTASADNESYVPMVLDLLLRLLRAPTPQPTLELLQAVFARLTSGQSDEREAAQAGLRRVLRALTNNPADAATAAESSNERTAVWVDTLTQLPHFKDAAVQALVLQGLAAALMRETLFGVMAAYLQFLCAHAHDEAALAVHVARMLVSRRNATHAILSDDSCYIVVLMLLRSALTSKTGIASDATEEDRITLNTDAGQHTAMPRVLLQAAAILLSFTSSTWGPGKYTPAAATTMYDSLVRLLLAPTTSVGEGRTPIVLVLGPTTLLQSACGPVVMAAVQAVPLPELVSLLTRAGSLSLVAVGEACSRLVTQADLGQLSPLQSPAALNLLRGYVAAGVRPAQNLLDVVAPAAPAPASKPSLFASFLSQASSKPAHSAVPVPTLVLPHTLPADDHTAATDGGDPMSVEPSAHPSSTAAAVVAVTAVDREEVMRTPPVPRLESLSASGLGHALRDALSDPVEQQQQQGSAVSARLAVVYAAMCREALLVDDDGNSLHRSMYDVQPSQALVLLDLLRSEARLQHEQLGTRRQCGIEIARQRLPLMMWALGKQPALSVPPLLAHLDRLLATAPSSIDAMIKHEDEADTTTSTAEQCERELLAVIRTAVIAAYRTLARPWLATRSHRALSVVEEDDELFRLGERKSAQTAVHEYTRQLLQPSTAQSAYVVLRSAAVTHPDLLLSYLPVLGSLVDARGSDTEEFVTRGHHRVMMHVLGVVDALRPAVFQDRERLAAFLDNYYALLSGMPERNKMAELLVSKLADFLCHYAACCQPDVLAHVDAITRAATLYPEIKKLGLCLRIAESSVAIPAVTHLSDAEVTQLRTQLLTSGTTESAMAQLDTASLRVNFLLQYVVTELAAIAADPLQSAALRDQAHTLLLRHAQQNPAEGPVVASHYLHCLSSSDEAVVQCALPHAADYVLLSADYAETLLIKLFALDRPALPHLRRAINLSVLL